ncbi:MAG: sensor histidine kinase [Promethearchaeota archaeon]
MFNKKPREIADKRKTKGDPTKIITRLLKKFINIPVDKMDIEINNTLKFLAKYIGGVDRCSILLLSDNNKRITNTHEWVSRKKFSRINKIQNIPINLQTFHLNFFLWDDDVSLENYENKTDDVELFGVDAIKPESQIYVPIKSKGRIIGALGLASFKKNRTWSREDNSFLTLIGEIIVNAIQRKNMEEALVRSEKYYRNLINNIPIGVVVFNLTENDELILSGANPATERILPVKAKAIIGKNLLDILPESMNLRHVETLKNVARKGGEFSIEAVNYEDKGVGKILEINVFQTSPREVAISFMDITEREKAKKILKLENIKLKELEKMRREFVSTTTHELKTPLSSVAGAADFLMNYYKSLKEDQVLKLIEILYRGSNRLKGLINDILDVYRIETNKFDIERRTVNICEIIENCIRDLQYLIENRNHELEIDIPRECMMDIDPLKIEQVITNLISNALKNTPPNGKIKVKMGLLDSEIVVSVQDDGVGLLPEEIDSLFKKFNKINREDLKADIDIQGTGLGLFISRQIVEAHGGKIWAESDGRFKGSKFSFTLPLGNKKCS